jgi:antitoxin component of MazEF toxin-antitoxin module
MINTLQSQKNVVFDTLLMEFAQLKDGDEMDIEIHEGGMLTLRPIRRREIYFDPVLMELAELNPGDEFDVDVDEIGNLTLTPIRVEPNNDQILEVIKSTMKDYAQTMKQLV